MLAKLQKEYLIDMEDVVVVAKDDKGKVKLHQAVSGKLADIGIDDKFMKELGETITAGSSALFVLVRKATPDKVLAELKGFRGKVLKTSLTEDKEEKLREVLSGI